MLVVLSGGTGGAKLIEGLAAAIDPLELTIICNTGDDAVFHGLYVSPDVDTISVLIPTRRPFASTSGPPLLPGLIDASVWM